MADGLSDVAVTASLAVWNFAQCPPARQLELGSAEIERQGKLAPLTRKILVEFAKIGREGWLGLLQMRRTRIHLQHAIFEFQSHQALGGRRQEEWADGRRRAEVKQSFHDAWRIARSLIRESCGSGARPRLEGAKPRPHTNKKASRFHGRRLGGGYCSYFGDCCCSVATGVALVEASCSKSFFSRLTSTRPPVMRFGLASLEDADTGALPMPTR